MWFDAVMDIAVSLLSLWVGESGGVWDASQHHHLLLLIITSIYTFVLSKLASMYETDLTWSEVTDATTLAHHLSSSALLRDVQRGVQMSTFTEILVHVPFKKQSARANPSVNPEFCPMIGRHGVGHQAESRTCGRQACTRSGNASMTSASDCSVDLSALHPFPNSTAVHMTMLHVMLSAQCRRGRLSHHRNT